MLLNTVSECNTPMLLYAVYKRCANVVFTLFKFNLSILTYCITMYVTTSHCNATLCLNEFPNLPYNVS